MLFLKELPSRQMIDGYARAYGMPADSIAQGLSMMPRASLLIPRLESYVAKHRLSQPHFPFLIVIDREPARDTLTAGEITARLDVAGPIIARTLRMLETKGSSSSRRMALTRGS